MAKPDSVRRASSCDTTSGVDAGGEGGKVVVVEGVEEVVVVGSSPPSWAAAADVDSHSVASESSSRRLSSRRGLDTGHERLHVLVATPPPTYRPHKAGRE